MNGRTVAGLVIGLGGVGAIAFGLSRFSTPTAPIGQFGIKPATSGAQVAPTQTGPAVSVGVANGAPPVNYVDTGPADYTTYNRPGWDYAPRVVLGGS